MFPTAFREAKVVPLYKERLASSYRLRFSRSLSGAGCRFGFFTSSQFGFKVRRSTELGSFVADRLSRGMVSRWGFSSIWRRFLIASITRSFFKCLRALVTAPGQFSVSSPTCNLEFNRIGWTISNPLNARSISVLRKVLYWDLLFVVYISFVPVRILRNTPCEVVTYADDDA